MKTTVHFTLALAATLMLGCNNRPEPSGYGSAHLEVSARNLSLADVAKVIVTVSGPHISPDIVATLEGNPTTGWSGTIPSIPAGPDRTFTAVAMDAADVPLYSGSVTGVTIVDGETVSVGIFLQQSAPPTPFANSVPRFTSLVISDDTVAPGQTITLTVAAVDPDPGDTLTYAWTANGGALGSPSTATTTWTAPTTPGIYQLVATAADPKGATATLSVDLDVEVYNGNGDVLLNATLNTWPVVESLVPNPTRIDVGETTHLDLTASDPDGDALSFAWTLDCEGMGLIEPLTQPVYGAFDDPTAEDPSFTLSQLPDLGACTLTATISDGRGGTNTASITIETGPGIGGPISGGNESPADCANGLDDDGDGLVDCADPDCDQAVCRGRLGECDAVERCALGICPADELLPSLTPCRRSRGGCDQSEACTGTDPRCPADTVASSGTMCRDVAGPCDVAEVCDGVSADCPADVLAGPEVVCRAADDVCDRAENCTGVSPSCPLDQAQESGTECRAAAGVCDLAERCDGVSHACPEDKYREPGVGKGIKPLLFPCRRPKGGCDLIETCDGTSPDCPPDQLRPQGYVCRTAAGSCDTTAEVCDGVSVDCPADVQSCQPTEYCSGDTCLAKLPTGSACSSEAECASGYCVDGVCCGSACSAGCQACDLPGSVGTCAPRPRGTDPEDACGEYNCDGSGSCLHGGESFDGVPLCSSASDCKPEYYCHISYYPDSSFIAACVPDSPQGATCSEASQCATGYCPNGVCCDTACTGGCEACSSAGVCTALPRGTDPKNACGAYNCDGSGGCVVAGTSDGGGGSVCSSVSDCKSAYFCSTTDLPDGQLYHACVPDLPLGSACSDGPQCASGSCTDGVCCDKACPGGCEACNLSGHVGTCTPRERGTDPELACGVYDCSGTGVCLQSGDWASSTSCDYDTDCKPDYHCYQHLGGNQYSVAECEADRPQGTICTHDSQCKDGHCSDGICCNTACNGQCQGCAVPGHVGTCFNYPRGSDPDNDCGQFVCSGYGSCVSQCTPLCGNPGFECKSSGWCWEGTCVPDLGFMQGCWDSCQCSFVCGPNPAYAACILAGGVVFGPLVCAAAQIPLAVCLTP